MTAITELSISDLIANKKRNLLTLFSIVISVLLVGVILTLSLSFYKKMVEEMKVSDENVVTVAFGISDNSLNYYYLPLLTEDDISLIKDTNGISNVTGIKALSITALTVEATGKKLISSYLYGVSDDYINNLSLNFTKGRIAENNNEIIIGSSIQEASDLNIGDYLQVDINGDTRKLKIVGIIEKQEEQAFSTLPSEINRMIATTSEGELFNDINFIYITCIANDVKHLQGLSQEIVSNVKQDEDLMKSLDGTEYRVVAVTRHDVVEMLSRWFSYIILFIILIALVINIVSLINIINVMATSIREKYKTIAVYKMVGASRKQVREIFLKQCFILGFVGSIIGIFLGAILGLILLFILGWPIKIYAWVFLLAGITGVGTSTIAGAFVAKKAEKIEIRVLLNEAE